LFQPRWTKSTCASTECPSLNDLPSKLEVSISHGLMNNHGNPDRILNLNRILTTSDAFFE
jgi:hypothetical protein